MDNTNFVYTTSTLSNSLSLDEVITRLKGNSTVDGLAFFGSRISAHYTPVSDFDLLILIDSASVNIFQLLTHIDHRMADVAFVSVVDADRAVSGLAAKDWTLVQRLFMFKMRHAQIAYDRSQRLVRAQRLAQDLAATQQLMPRSSYESIYAAWFWQNFLLRHIKRMAQSEDHVYQTATDMMLLTALGGLCRDYFIVRSLPWEGEKAAIGYFESNDHSFLDLFRESIACLDRRQKIKLYEELVTRVIEPCGELWDAGVAAAFLVSPPKSQADVEKELIFWEALVS